MLSVDLDIGDVVLEDGGDVDLESRSCQYVVYVGSGVAYRARAMV